MTMAVDPAGVTPALELHLGRLGELAKGSDPFGHLLVETPRPEDPIPAGIACRYCPGGSFSDVRYTVIEGARLVEVVPKPARYWRGHVSRLTIDVDRFGRVARELGKLVVGARWGFPIPPDVAALCPGADPVWPYGRNDDDACRWDCLLHWLAWSGRCPELRAERKRWSGEIIVPYDRGELDRVRTASGGRGPRLDDTDVILGRWCSELTDVVAASVVAVHWLLGSLNPAAPKQTRLRAHLDEKVPFITLDGKPFPPFDECATRYVARLIEADGEQVAVSGFIQARKGCCEGARSTQVLNAITDGLSPFIDRSQGKAPRLKVELLG
jgi:hypothetical protein